MKETAIEAAEGSFTPTTKAVRGEPSSPVTETKTHPEHHHAETDEIDMKDYMEKLDGIKTNFQKIKDIVLYGTVIGKQIEFTQLVKKLKLEWYWVNGRSESHQRATSGLKSDVQTHLI